MNDSYHETTVWVVVNAVARTILILLNNVYAIPTYLMWLFILYPLKMISADLYNYIEGVIYSWLLQMVALWSWTAGYTVEEYGVDISDCVDDECIVVCNHQSTSDVPVLMYTLTHGSKGRLGRQLYWIMDILFKYTSFGWVSMVHGDFFIRQGRITRQLQRVMLAKHLETVYMEQDRSWILVFPEGGFLYKRRADSQEYARRNGYPHLQHLTLPRTGALQTVLSTLSPLAEKSAEGDCTVQDGLKKKQLKWMVDMTIAYPNGESLSLLDILFGHHKPCKTAVYFRRFPVRSIPCDEESLQQWMFDRWVEKERLLDHFYRTGEFPIESQPKEYELPVESKLDRKSDASPVESKPNENSDASPVEFQPNGNSDSSSVKSQPNGNSDALPVKSQPNRNSEASVAAASKPRSLEMNIYWFLILHVFFISSTYFHWHLICNVASFILYPFY